MGAPTIRRGAGGAPRQTRQTRHGVERGLAWRARCVAATTHHHLPTHPSLREAMKLRKPSEISREDLGTAMALIFVAAVVSGRVGGWVGGWALVCVCASIKFG